ncbi:melatonin receptor type 1A-like [Saccoglossus kowalevskii]
MPLSTGDATFAVISAIVYITTTVVGTSENVLVCYMVYANKPLRTGPNYQLVSLALSDIIVCLIPSSMRFILTLESLCGRKISITGMTCEFQLFILYASLCTTVLMSASININRAISVTNKTSLSTKRNLNIAFIIVSWIVGNAYGVFKAIAGEDITCNTFQPLSPISPLATKTGVGVSFICFLSIFASYIVLYRITHKHELAVAASLQCPGSQRRRKPLDIATLTTGVLLLAFYLISYMPFTILSLLLDVGLADRGIHCANFVVSLACFGSLINPLIYTLNSNQFNARLPWKKNAVTPIV